MNPPKPTKVLKRQNMSFASDLGKYYLELRKKSLELGSSKAKSIPYIINYIQEFSRNGAAKLKVVDFGCSDGIFLNNIASMCPKGIEFTGIDYNESVLDLAKKSYQDLKFLKKDLYNDSVEEISNNFDLAYSINTLHEIFSFYGANGILNFSKGKQAVETSFKNIAKTIRKDGILILFDGIESWRRDSEVTIELLTDEAEVNFLKFAKEYKPLSIEYLSQGDRKYKMKYQYFTRFITKYRFLNTPVWNLECEESYQYFNRYEFIDMFVNNGFKIESISMISPNIGEWSKHVRVLEHDQYYPEEHILIVGRKISL
jgi:SAM-dependent methyltransferase